MLQGSMYRAPASKPRNPQTLNPNSSADQALIMLLFEATEATLRRQGLEFRGKGEHHKARAPAPGRTEQAAVGLTLDNTVF